MDVAEPGEEDEDVGETLSDMSEDGVEEEDGVSEELPVLRKRVVGGGGGGCTRLLVLLLRR